ncbi:acyl-CoA dehydrogenase family protein [Actinocorallia populi]|uniref:acyl-CoA dehydrogenase family protein n=1 Tax=Actinocorallia populi TaxID=2079200 RepID=UPI000D0937FF|nr:acyl-CoA dehydrogenase family protein [Actinocorallia populi]
MTADLTGFHEELRVLARGLLGKAASGAAPDWRSIARSGWLGLEAPEPLDGADATFAEVAVVLREAGRAAARGPYPAVAALGVGALGLLEPSPGRDRLFRETVAGAAVPVTALEGEAVEGVPFRLERTGRGLLLHGTAAFVPGAPVADRLLLPALGPDGTPVVVEAGPDAPGLEVTEQPVVDETRRFGLVTARGVEAGPDAVWRFRGDPEASVRRLHERAAIAVACDSLGLSEAMLEATVAYAGVREQFGRAIGSFQAVKHACADMLVQVKVSGKLVEGAVRGQVDGGRGTGVAASMAKSHACAAAVEVAGKAMQLHGGMGYTWESGIHVYLKRAVLNRSLSGSPAAHRRRLAGRYPAFGLGAGERLS